MQIPIIALSVRQPWAWAIIHGGKDIENRTTFAITKGGVEPKRICIHASKGMTRGEYEDTREFMAELGVTCPRPNELVRGAVIGAVTVDAVVRESESPWFFGPRGLVLSEPTPIEPIPALGALGYFRWAAGGEIAAPLPWMLAWPGTPSRPPPQGPMPLFSGEA